MSVTLISPSPPEERVYCRNCGCKLVWEKRAGMYLHEHPNARYSCFYCDDREERRVETISYEVGELDAHAAAREVLDRIEKERGVRVLYACEAGSRAWGFSSRDSDYDVRFIYVHPLKHYVSLNVENKRDVIEIDEAPMDLVGWDVRKALKLARKSNPSLMEWTRSPIVYHREEASYELLDLVRQSFHPRAAFHHYRRMAKRNFRRYIKDRDEIKLKSYLYALRPSLSARWVKELRNPPPLTIDELLEWWGLSADGPPGLLDRAEELRNQIEWLLRTKRSGDELGTGPKLPELSRFLERELKHMKEQGFEAEAKKLPIEKYNRIYRRIIADA